MDNKTLIEALSKRLNRNKTEVSNMIDGLSTYGITDDKKLSIIALGIIGFSREMICSILSITSKG
ncbi:MAG: hypothetical protein UHE93_01840, partial [Muribaculaceae bacterium]|nr:hypothetical protein [Muribaculaceae bacterium]